MVGLLGSKHAKQMEQSRLAQILPILGPAILSNLGLATRKFNESGSRDLKFSKKLAYGSFGFPVPLAVAASQAVDIGNAAILDKVASALDYLKPPEITKPAKYQGQSQTPPNRTDLLLTLPRQQIDPTGQNRPASSTLTSHRLNEIPDPIDRQKQADYRASLAAMARSPQFMDIYKNFIEPVEADATPGTGLISDKTGRRDTAGFTKMGLNFPYSGDALRALGINNLHDFRTKLTPRMAATAYWNNYYNSPSNLDSVDRATALRMMDTRVVGASPQEQATNPNWDYSSRARARENFLSGVPNPLPPTMMDYAPPDLPYMTPPPGPSKVDPYVLSQMSGTGVYPDLNLPRVKKTAPAEGNLAPSAIDRLLALLGMNIR